MRERENAIAARVATAFDVQDAAPSPLGSPEGAEIATDPGDLFARGVRSEGRQLELGRDRNVRSPTRNGGLPSAVVRTPEGAQAIAPSASASGRSLSPSAAEVAPASTGHAPCAQQREGAEGAESEEDEKELRETPKTIPATPPRPRIAKQSALTKNAPANQAAQRAPGQ